MLRKRTESVRVDVTDRYRIRVPVGEIDAIEGACPAGHVCVQEEPIARVAGCPKYIQVAVTVLPRDATRTASNAQLPGGNKA